MTVLVLAATSFLFPGFAHGFAHRRMWMFVWAALGVLSMVAIAVSSWGLLGFGVVRLCAVVDGFRVLRAEPPARRSNGTLGLIAFGIAAVGSVGARLLVFEAFKIPASSGYPTLQIGDHVYVEKLSRLWRAPDRGEIIVFRQPCNPEHDYVKRVIAVANDTIEVRCNVVYVNGAALANELVDADCTYEDSDVYDRDRRTVECSRYRETLDDRSYEVFHDSERPSRDQLTGRDRVDRRDFPEDTTPRFCGNVNDFESSAADNQLRGEIIQTRADVGPADSCQPHMHYKVPPGHVFVMGDNRSNSNDSRYWGSVPVDNVVGRVVSIWLPLGRIGGVD